MIDLRETPRSWGGLEALDVVLASGPGVVIAPHVCGVSGTSVVTLSAPWADDSRGIGRIVAEAGHRVHDSRAES